MWFLFLCFYIRSHVAQAALEYYVATDDLKLPVLPPFTKYRDFRYLLIYPSYAALGTEARVLGMVGKHLTY